MHGTSIENNESIDRVCGLICSHIPEAIQVEYGGARLSFCGEGCFMRFKQDPKKYSGQPLIRVSNVSKTFTNGESQTSVLRGVNLNIWEGDFVSIVGSSGSGKSTLLNMLGLLDRPTGGKIYIRGNDVSTLNDIERAKLRSETFGFVFQQYNLIPWLSAYENVTIPNIFAGKKPDKKKLYSYFNAMGIENRSHHLPTQLSGGEQQRVALIRAIANDPLIILGDEPTGNLDSKTGRRLLEMLVDLKREYKKTLIVVTHDRTIAEMADEVITIHDGEIVPDATIHKSEI